MENPGSFSHSPNPSRSVRTCSNLIFEMRTPDLGDKGRNHELSDIVYCIFNQPRPGNSISKPRRGVPYGSARHLREPANPARPCRFGPTR